MGQSAAPFDCIFSMQNGVGVFCALFSQQQAWANMDTAHFKLDEFAFQTRCMTNASSCDIDSTHMN
eukprot:3059836-Pleurochrysis_carterae.AAC.1